MPKGGKRANAGRKPGTPNKRTYTEMLEIRALAQTHAEAAIERLAQIAQQAESEAASVAACNAILDRAYGKPAQTIAGDPENPVHLHQMIEQVIIDPVKGRGS